MSVINSPNMNLPVPVVGVEPGPQWASDINACMNIVDQHDHSSGSGVQITPNGLNINGDLVFNNNNATGLRSARFAVQASPIALPSDVGCLYESGVDLYYNDGNGTQIRITQSGGVAGSPGSISNLVPPASASYVPGTQTFVWQAGANIAANMDAASYIFRNPLITSSNGVTVSAPAALGSNYTLVLPLLPVSQKIMTLDASGNMAAPYTVDGSTIVIAANIIKVPTSGITSNELAANSVITSKILNGNVTLAKLNADVNISTLTRVATYSVAGADTFVVPADVNKIMIEAVGGGGGGAGSVSNPVSQGGWGCKKTFQILSVTGGNTYNLVVGTGGGGGAGAGANGSAGTNSTFDGNIVAFGAPGGSFSPSPTTSAMNDLKSPNYFAPGIATVIAAQHSEFFAGGANGGGGGGGGASSFGAGGFGGGPPQVGQGAGAGGGASFGTGNGAAGADGQIIIYY